MIDSGAARSEVDPKQGGVNFLLSIESKGGMRGGLFRQNGLLLIEFGFGPCRLVIKLALAPGFY